MCLGPAQRQCAAATAGVFQAQEGLIVAMEDADLLLLEGSVYSNILTTGLHLVVCVRAPRVLKPSRLQKLQLFVNLHSSCTHKHAPTTAPIVHALQALMVN